MCVLYTTRSGPKRRYYIKSVYIYMLHLTETVDFNRHEVICIAQCAQTISIYYIVQWAPNRVDTRTAKAIK